MQNTKNTRIVLLHQVLQDASQHAFLAILTQNPLQSKYRSERANSSYYKEKVCDLEHSLRKPCQRFCKSVAKLDADINTLTLTLCHNVYVG